MEGHTLTSFNHNYDKLVSRNCDYLTNVHAKPKLIITTSQLQKIFSRNNTLDVHRHLSPSSFRLLFPPEFKMPLFPRTGHRHLSPLLPRLSSYKEVKMPENFSQDKTINGHRRLSHLFLGYHFLYPFFI